jgi:hypothetical protein
LSGEKDSLELEKAAPFTYEEKLIKEKDVI